MARISMFKALVAVLLTFFVAACDSEDKDFFVKDDIRSWVSDLVSLGSRRPGSAAERSAQQYIMDRYREFGLEDIRREPFEITVWNADQYTLTVNGRNIPCFYLPYSAFTPAEGLSADLVYLGEGREEDFAATDVAGKIVAVDIRFGAFELLGITLIEAACWNVTNWQAYDLAVSHGAAGFVGILADYFDRNTYYAPMDNPSKPFYKRNIPGLWLSRSDGEGLREAMGGGETATARLGLTGTAAEGETANVFGFIPGKTDEIILIHSHHDSAFGGAVEDGTGTAEVLALAKYFGRKGAPKLNRTLLFLSATGHFYNYKGHEVFILSHMNDLIPRIVADICIEHIGLEVEEVDGQIVKTGRNNLTGIFTTRDCLGLIASEAVVCNGLSRTLVVPWAREDEMESDALYYHALGIPVVSLISAPLYLYDAIDTLDLVADDQLAPVACAFADIINTVDKIPTTRLK
jgi:hypothetical protein